MRVKCDKVIRKIVSATFPEYRGRTFRLSTEVPHRLDSWWDGGSRNYYAFYHLDQERSLPVHSNHPMFEKNQPRVLKQLPLRTVLVEHCYFCGNDLGITIYANQADLALLLPENGSSRFSNEGKNEPTNISN
jgi:hypothetical protein